MSSSTIQSIHHIHHGLGYLTSWNKTHKPLLHVDSGSEVTFNNFEAGYRNLTRETTDADLEQYNIQGLEDIEKLTGPIHISQPVYVNDAQPGDTLKIEILDLQTAEWGWTCVFPGLGVFKDEFKDAHVKIYDLAQHDDFTVFKKGIHIPRQPFYGTMGVASAQEGDFHALLPRNDVGGNIDCRYIGKGATLYLPVNVPGALFSVGDGHYAQGDGEICGTAIETLMKSRIRLTILKGKTPLKSPQYDTAVQEVVKMHSVGSKGEHGVVATSEEQSIAARQAVEGLMEWLVLEKGLTRLEAYMLISVAGNLKIMHEIGIPIHTVSASIPLGLFVGGSK